METGHKICISKKVTYISLFGVFLISIVLLGQTALKSNQATNSKAFNTTKKPAADISYPKTPPSCPLYCSYVKPTFQKENKLIFYASPKELELIYGAPYAIYMYDSSKVTFAGGGFGPKDGTLLTIDIPAVTPIKERDKNKSFILYKIEGTINSTTSPCDKKIVCNNFPNTPKTEL